MKYLLLATTLAAASLLAPAAHATLITGFTQTSNSNTVTATENVGQNQTTISTTNTSVNLGGGILGAIPGALLTFTATSIDAAVNNGGNITQHYNGSFCVSSGAGCTGNFLSGTFQDAAFGANGGPGLTVQVSNPPEQLALTSNVLTAAELNPPSALSLAFSALNNPLAIVGTSIGSFTASVSGTVSASSVAVPEPGSIAVLGVGLLGLGAALRFRRRSV